MDFYTPVLTYKQSDCIVSVRDKRLTQKTCSWPMWKVIQQLRPAASSKAPVGTMHQYKRKAELDVGLLEGWDSTGEPEDNRPSPDDSPPTAAYKASVAASSQDVVNTQQGPGVTSQDRLDAVGAENENAAVAAAWHKGEAPEETFDTEAPLEPIEPPECFTHNVEDACDNIEFEHVKPSTKQSLYKTTIESVNIDISLLVANCPSAQEELNLKLPYATILKAYVAKTENGNIQNLWFAADGQSRFYAGGSNLSKLRTSERNSAPFVRGTSPFAFSRLIRYTTRSCLSPPFKGLDLKAAFDQVVLRDDTFKDFPRDVISEYYNNRDANYAEVLHTPYGKYRGGARPDQETLQPHEIHGR